MKLDGIVIKPKIAGNRTTWNKLRDHMDLDASGAVVGEETLGEAGKRIFDEILETASGRLTKAKISVYIKSMYIYTVGPGI